MNISQSGIDLIKYFEGCRLEAYKCPAGVWTIGYGHTGKDVTQGLKITQEKADDLLKSDLLIHCRNVEKLVKVPINQNQFNALVSFEFNVGCVAFANSTLLRLLNDGKYTDAAAQFDRWVYAGKAKCMGLINRRLVEKKTFLS